MEGKRRRSSDDLSPRNEKTSWKRSIDYAFGLVGMMIALGNIWRFPYLCFKNGGGAFLVAYLIFVVFLIFPIVVMESAMGQLTGLGPIRAWNLIPLFKGLGFAGAVIMSYSNIYYPILLVWGLRWLYASFSTVMPWTSCKNTWNTNSCLPLYLSENNSSNLGRLDLSTANRTTYQSSVEEFWSRNILQISTGIDNLGGLKPDLTLCLLIIWIITYFSMWKGVGWTSKIVYVTATLPLALIVIIVVRGATLEGARDGIEQYLKPRVKKLQDFQVWADAASQVLYSFAACSGCLITMSSYNKSNHNFFRDAIICTSMNAFASFLSGFAVFSVLGYLSYAKNSTIDEVVRSGPDLVYVAYPTALSLLPMPQFWIALFSVTILFLGLDSHFAYIESTIACLRDVFPHIFRKKWSNEIAVAVLSVVYFLLGLTMATNGGVYVLNLMNTYSVSGWCLYFLALVETVGVGWFYGADHMVNDIKNMVGYNVPKLYLKVCWKFVIPASSLVLMAYSLILYQPLTYDNDRRYPLWADVIGWITAFSSVLCIPVVAAGVLWTAEGDSFVEKWRTCTKSTITKISSSEKSNEKEPLKGKEEDILT